MHHHNAVYWTNELRISGSPPHDFRNWQVLERKRNYLRQFRVNRLSLDMHNSAEEFCLSVSSLFQLFYRAPDSAREPKQRVRWVAVLVEADLNGWSFSE